MNNEGFFKWTDSSPFTYSSEFRRRRRYYLFKTHSTLFPPCRLVPRARAPVIQRSELETAQRRRAQPAGLRRTETGVPAPEPTAQVFQPQLVVHLERSRLFGEKPIPMPNATAHVCQRLR